MALIYLYDHGDDVDNKLGHESSRFTYPMSRIPMLIKVSDAFKATHPHMFETLKNNQDAVFTNDLLDNLLAAMFNIRGLSEYDPRFNLSSKRYELNKENALTLHGQKSLAQ